MYIYVFVFKTVHFNLWFLCKSDLCISSFKNSEEISRIKHFEQKNYNILLWFRKYRCELSLTPFFNERSLIITNTVLLMKLYFTDDIGDQLCERGLGVLFEIWLIACVKSFPGPTLWKTLREMCMNWRHRAGRRSIIFIIY